MGRFGDWFQGKGLEEDFTTEPDARRAEGSPYAAERDLDDRADPEPGREIEPKPVPPGWYQVDGTLRYYDGERWTEHLAPPYPTSLMTTRIAGAVFSGVLGALFVVWLGAQAEPDHVYLPVKFVVEELPEALR